MKSMLVPVLLPVVAVAFSGRGTGGGFKSTANNGTPTGTYMVMVTTISGSLSHTAIYSFTVHEV
jgi:hypothetical protein